MQDTAPQRRIYNLRMQRTHTYGLFAAATLGFATGVAIAPPLARVELSRRFARALRPITRATARQYWTMQEAARRLTGDATAAASGAYEAVQRQILAHRTPTNKVKTALRADALLARRQIWVDAVGDTILLHGIVDDDEEWRRADLLARSVWPDGSVRNLLQVRRAADAEP